MLRYTCPSRRTKHAFTLLELILVLALISLMLTVVAASLRGFYADRKIDDAATHLLALAKQARQSAVREASEYSLHLDPSKRTYWLTTQKNGLDEQIPTEWGRTFELPRGVEAWWAGDSSETEERTASFSADGSVEPFSVLLVTGSRNDEARLLTCLGANGQFNIHSFEEFRDAQERVSSLE